MGKRGPAQKPTNVRYLHGDDKTHPERINTAEPKPAAKEVRQPSWLSTAARRVWSQYAPDLKRQGVLTAWDTETFAIWCDAVVRRRAAVKHLEAEGEVIEQPVFSRDGEVTGSRIAKNPWTLVLNEADGQVQRYGARFGLTPSDRAQIKLGGADRDGKDDLLS